MRLHRAFFVAGLVSFSLSCASRQPESASGSGNASWPERLYGHTLAVRTIDPGDENWSDLSGLEPLLKDVRLVLLGEATHGDGAAFLAKTRLVKFLHERLGYDLLVFESGFYECFRAWPPTTGSPFQAAFDRCAWAMWSQRHELDPLVGYLDRARAGARPLILAGLDPDIGVMSEGDRRARELRTLSSTIGNLGVSEADLSALLSFADHAVDYRSRKRAVPSRDSLQVVTETAERFASALRTTDRLSERDRLYWALVLENLAMETRARLITQMYSSAPPDPQAAWEANLARDAQMAKNLQWLMDAAYPGSKAIVWASTVHAARQLSSVSFIAAGDEPTPYGFSLQELFNRRRTLADHLYDRFGSSMYAIGITAGGGTTAGGPSGRPIPAPSKGSIEELLARTPHEYLFLDLRNLTPPSEAPLVARPIGHTDMRSADWGAVLDGILFIRSMTASTPRQSR